MTDHKKLIIILLTTTFAIGLFLRVYQVTRYDLNIIESVGLDMARIDDLSFKRDLKWTYTHFFLFQDTIGEPMGEITTRNYYRLTNNAILSARMNSLILGSLMVFVLYYLFYLLSENKYLSLFSAAAANFSFIMVFFSRYAYQQLPMAFFFVLFLAVVIFMLKKNHLDHGQKQLLTVIGSSSLIIGFLFHPLMSFAAAGLAIFLLYDFWIQKGFKREWLKENKPFLIMLLVFVIGLGFIFPRGALSPGATNVSFIFGNAGLDNGLGNFAVSYLGDRFEGFVEKIKLIFSYGNPRSIFSVMPLWTLIIATVGLASLVRTGGRAINFFILSATVVFLSSTFFLADSSPLYRMYLPFFVFLFFCFSVGAFYLFKIARIPRRLMILAVAILLASELAFTLNSIFWRSDNFPKTSSGIYNPNEQLRMAESVSFLEQKEINKDIAVDTIDKGPAYYLKDRGLEHGIIDDQTLKEAGLPKVYFSDYVYLKDKDVQNIINNNYNKIMDGIYLRLK